MDLTAPAVPDVPPTPGTDLVTQLRSHPVVAVVRAADAAVAADIARGCLAGGLRLVEITLTTPDACRLMSDLAREVPDTVTIGAGTVLDPVQLADAAGAGARFLVSPVVDRELLAAARTAGLPFVPGAATPTEIHTAARLGAPVVKVFPAGGLGLPFLKSVVAVLPSVPLMPSGGVGVADVPAWLDAGAVAVAIGSELNTAHARGGRAAVADLAASAAAVADRYARPSAHAAQPRSSS